ncbi:chaperone Ric-8B [Eucyclogobius newberryi]|uniref:chaperone Ric-8B n=1 Tax=Eucyclogobius newberryi TaxID=166745 RepID=UPI003B599542
MDLNQMLSGIEDRNDEEIEQLLQRYNRENCRTFTFDQKEEALRIKLCQSTLSVLRRQVPYSCQKTCLETLRIMSRDKRVLSPVATREGMLTLSAKAGLNTGEDAERSQHGLQQEGLSDEEERVVVEALKCLCNVVFNSPAAQQVSVDVHLATALCGKLHGADTWHHDVGLFTLRLLFLLSALRPDLRMCLRKDCRAVTLLTKMLEHTLDINWVGPYEAGRPDPQALPVPAESNERVMEALKALFNLTLNDPDGEEDEHQFRVIVGLLHHVLMLKTETMEKTEELHSHAVNLLNNLSVSRLDVLINLPVQGGSENYNGKNLTAVQVLLDFMEKRIDRGFNFKEGLTPVLCLLTEASRHHREIRRYLKAQVLPPLKNLKVKPEVGNTIRNKLVRLMTHVDLGVKHSAAEFLFVLCKEKVASLLKYTGYGNAAGLLMVRGLLGGGQGETQYSEGEDSDTEEYKSATNFDIMSGCEEEPRPNPVEEMTEEQKEYEAEKLIQILNKLKENGVIRPMVRGPDGRLGPLEEQLHKSVEEDAASDSD